MLTVFEDVSRGRYLRTAVSSSNRNHTKGKLTHKALERIEGNLTVDGKRVTVISMLRNELSGRLVIPTIMDIAGF